MFLVPFQIRVDQDEAAPIGAGSSGYNVLDQTVQNI